MRHSSDNLFEGLEPRRLLSVSFASVGFAWDTGWAFFDVDTFSTEGELGESDDVDGVVYRAGRSDRDLREGLWYDSIFDLPIGRYDRDPLEGFYGSPDERNGARFSPVDRYPVGWWYSEYDRFAGDAEDAELLVTLRDDPTLDDYGGAYQYAAIAYRADADTPLEEPGVHLTNGRMTVGDLEVRWTPSRGSEYRYTSRIDRINDFGSLITARREYLYLSADGSTIIYADMADDDDVTTIGVATRAAASIDPDTLAGVYLTLYCDGPDEAPDFRQRAFELDEDGDYALYDLDEYDDGHLDPLEIGEWRIVGDRVVLEERWTGGERTFVLGENGSTLLATELRENGVARPLFALGVKALADPVPHDPVFNVSAHDGFGRPQIFQLETDDVWYVVDVVATIGGPVPIGEVVSWVDPKDGLSYGAAVSSQGLILYTEGEDDTWSFRNLTLEVFGGVVPSGELDVMIGPDEIVHLTALAPEGDLLHYAQTGAQDDQSAWRWGFENISEEDLAPAGVATPEFSGLVSYATSWNGLNVVGLDEAGNIWGVWTAPGRERWSVSNLTSAYGAEPLAGGLTVYLTPWGGINIAGIDDAGHLRVTWWVPQFKGEWAQSDLTALTVGPLYEPERLGSFVSSWGGLNIVGADRASGEVVVTWWSPARGDEGWAVVSLSDAVPPGSPVIAAPFTGIAAPDESLNVFGYAGADFVRYYWEPDFGGDWEVQNLTDISVTR